MKKILRNGIILCAVVASSIGGVACATYDAPPAVSLVDAKDGVLSDVSKPMRIGFSEPIDPSSLRIKVALNELDVEGNLGDEDTLEETTLQTLFEYDPVLGPVDGEFSLSGSRQLVTVKFAKAPPMGRKLVVIVEPGLSDDDSNKTAVREKIQFGYEFKCKSEKATKGIPDGKYFFALNVEQPLPVQVQLFAHINVDVVTGKLIGQFTNADRNRALGRCPMECDESEACRLVPAPECVEPSSKVASVDEFSDFLPNVTPPTGYSFTVYGCAEDLEDGRVAIGTFPADMIVESPAVTVRDLVMSASFEVADSGVLARGSGRLTASDVLLTDFSTGAGKGSMEARSLSDAEAPTGIPLPSVEP